jgi:hypothetical protein
MQEHAHPNCVVMASQLIANLEWTLTNITEGVQEDSEKCVVERIQANLRELASLKKEIEAAKQEQLRKLKALGQEHLQLLQEMKTL